MTGFRPRWSRNGRNRGAVDTAAAAPAASVQDIIDGTAYPTKRVKLGPGFP